MSHEHLGCACSNLPTLTSSLLTETALSGELEAAFQQAYSQPSQVLAPRTTIFHNGVIHTMAAWHCHWTIWWARWKPASGPTW